MGLLHFLFHKKYGIFNFFVKILYVVINKTIGASMSEEYESIKRGLEQAIAYTNGDMSQCRISYPESKVNRLCYIGDIPRLSRVNAVVNRGPEIELLRHGSETLFVKIDNGPHGEKMMVVNDEHFLLQETSTSGLFRVVGLTYYDLLVKIKNQDNNVITFNVVTDEN
jgi:hypothetical protein